MMTSSKPLNPYNSKQIFLNVAKYYFQFGLLLFQRHIWKVSADDDVIVHDDVTCMITLSLIYCVDYDYVIFDIFVGSVAEWVKASFLRRPGSNDLGSTRTLVTLLRPWIRRFTMIISARWFRTSSKFSGQEFEEIHRNIGSSETPKQVRIPPITK